MKKAFGTRPRHPHRGDDIPGGSDLVVEKFLHDASSVDRDGLLRRWWWLHWMWSVWPDGTSPDWHPQSVLKMLELMVWRKLALLVIWSRQAWLLTIVVADARLPQSAGIANLTNFDVLLQDWSDFAWPRTGQLVASLRPRGRGWIHPRTREQCL